MKPTWTVSRGPRGWRLRGPGSPQANRFLQRLNLRGLAEGSQRTYALDLLCLWRWLRRRRRRRHRPELLYEFLRDHHGRLAPSTLNRRLRLLYRFLAFAHPRSFAPLSRRPRRGAPALPAVREPRRVKPPLRDVQVQRLLGALHTWRDRLIVALIWTLGLRADELLRLELAGAGEPTLRVRGKGGAERLLPFPEPVRPLLERYLQQERPPSKSPRLLLVLKAPRRGRPLSYAGLRRVFRYYRQRLALPEAHPHRFRHTFAVNMIRRGLSVPLLMALMGHRHPSTTLHYVSFDESQVRQDYEEALRQLDIAGHLRTVL